jgi:hypothetical protein
MTVEELIKDLDMCEDRYDCYHPAVPVQIFNCLIDTDNAEECEINIPKDYDLIKIFPLINNYLNWLKECDKELISYFQKRLGESVPHTWFETIEVYRFVVTFDSADDYGATISFGESIFTDHTMEFDFEKFQIVDDRLNG